MTLRKHLIVTTQYRFDNYLLYPAGHIMVIWRALKRDVCVLDRIHSGCQSGGFKCT